MKYVVEAGNGTSAVADPDRPGAASKLSLGQGKVQARGAAASRLVQLVKGTKSLC